ncbi:uncharacterized protein LOC111132813 isoform X1 [Crassostrea virginica]
MTSKAKPTNMRVPQILVLLTITVCVEPDGKSFGACTVDDDCPQNATCVIMYSNMGNCERDEDFYPYDSPVAVEGNAMVLCTPVVCFPSDENPCSEKGECVVEYGRFVCKCYKGYYGETCEKSSTSMTTPKITETRKGGYGGLLAAAGAGLFAVVLLGAGAAALTSSSG